MLTTNILKRKKCKSGLKRKKKKGKATNMDQVTEATAEIVILSAGTIMQVIDIKQEVITKTMKK